MTQFESSAVSKFGNIAKAAAAVGASVYVMNGFITQARAAIKSIDELKISTIQIAAQITTMQGPKNVAEHYKQATVYADALAKKLYEVDANSFANYSTLLQMTKEMTLHNVLLDVNNKKQVQSFTALSNAVAMYTAGQNQSIQAHQEIRALLTGETRPGAQLALQIDSMAKSSGLYKDGLKQIVAEGRKHGDTLERLMPFLTGINAASGDIATTWEAVSSSFETALGILRRAFFKDMFKDVVTSGAQFVSWMKESEGTATAWGKNFMRVLYDVEAEVIRLGGLLDKVGGTLTSAQMLLYGPGKALGIDSSTKRFDAAAANNMMFEERFKQRDKMLEDLAAKYVKLDEVATSAEKAMVPKLPPGVDHEAVEKARKDAEALAKQWENTAKTLNAEIRTSGLNGVEKAVMDITIKAEEMRKEFGNRELIASWEAHAKAVVYAKDQVSALVDELKAWQKTQDALDAMMVSTLPKREQDIEAIRQEYIKTTQAVWDLYDAGRITAEEADRRNAAAGNAQQVALEALQDVKVATDEISKLWEHAYERIADASADWLVDQKNGMAGLLDAFESMAAQMVVTWAMSQFKMSSMTDAEKISTAKTGGLAGVGATAVTGANATLGSTLGLAAGVNEFLNPGSMAAASLSIKLGMAGALKDAGFTGAAKSVVGMGQGTFGALTAGTSTFLVDLLSGKDFKQSAIEGLSSAGGFWAGMAISGGNPIVGMVGSVLATMGAGSLFGGKQGGPDKYTPGLLNYATDNSWDQYAGFSPVMDAHTAYSYPAANAGIDAYLEGVSQMQDTFQSQVVTLKGQMSQAAWDAFSNALSLYEFKDPDPGRVKVENAQAVTEQMLKDYAAVLDAGLNASLQAALPVLAQEMIIENTSFAILNDALQERIRSVIGSGSMTGDQLGQLSGFMDQISSAVSPIAEIMATHGLTDYEMGLRSVHQEFDAYGEQLTAAGIDLVKFTDYTTSLGYALEKTTLAEKARIASAAEAAANDNLSAAKTLLTNSFAAERNRLEEAHAGLIKSLNDDLGKVNDTIAILSKSIDAVHSAKLSMDLGTPAFSAQKFAQAQSVLFDVLNDVRGGNFNTLGKLDDNLATIAKPMQELYATSADYQRDYYKSYLSLAEIETLTGDQLTTEQSVAESLAKQIEVENAAYATQGKLLEDQLSTLQGIDTSILSLADAITQFLAAMEVSRAAGAAAGAADQPYTQYAAQDIRNTISNSGAKLPSDIYGLVTKYNANPYEVGAAYGLSVNQTQDYLHNAGIPGFATGTNFLQQDMVLRGHFGETITPKPFVDIDRADKRETNALLKQMSDKLAAVQAELLAIKGTNNRICMITEKSDTIGPAPARAEA
jgi:hypothetical protein